MAGRNRPGNKSRWGISIRPSDVTHGPTWVRQKKSPHQFAWVFSIIGDVSQVGFRLIDPKVKTAPEPSKIWAWSQGRYHSREAWSGYLNSDILRTGALGQVGEGWLRAPAPIDMGAASHGLPFKRRGFPFLLGAKQMGELRAFDGLR